MITACKLKVLASVVAIGCTVATSTSASAEPLEKGLHVSIEGGELFFQRSPGKSGSLVQLQPSRQSGKADSVKSVNYLRFRAPGMTVLQDGPAGFQVIDADGVVTYGLVMDRAGKTNSRPVPVTVSEGSLSIGMGADRHAHRDLQLVFGGKYFSNIKKGYSKGQPRYELYKTLYMEAVQKALLTPWTQEWALKKILGEAWGEATDWRPGLTAKGTLFQQYLCHAVFAHYTLGGAWGLEEHRRTLSGDWDEIAEMVKYRCNW